MNKQPAAPTSDSIRSDLVIEGQHYEFKARLNLNEQRGKSNFIDDVVAFLNAGPGYLVVGVHEKKGVFERFEPMGGDRDAMVADGQIQKFAYLRQSSTPSWF